MLESIRKNGGSIICGILMS